MLGIVSLRNTKADLWVQSRLRSSVLSSRVGGCRGGWVWVNVVGMLDGTSGSTHLACVAVCTWEGGNRLGRDAVLLVRAGCLSHCSQLPPVSFGSCFQMQPGAGNSSLLIGVCKASSTGQSRVRDPLPPRPSLIPELLHNVLSQLLLQLPLK